MSQRLLFVVNPCAGQRKATRYMAELIRMFSDYGWETAVYVTGGKNDARDYVAAHAAEFERVVCAGGDGTLNEVFSGLLKCGAKCPIGYLPCGTTNDYAGTLGLSGDMITAGHDVMTGIEKTFDAGRMNDAYFAYTCSFGAFTKTAYSTPQFAKNVLGHFAYVLEGIKDLPQIKPVHMKIDADGRIFEDDYIFGAVNNSTSVGGILKLDSELVGMDDGEFEVILVRNPANANQLSRIVMALSKNDFASDMLRFFPARKLAIEAPADLCWTRDGEYEYGGAHVEIENLHQGMRFIVPRKSRAAEEEDDPWA